MFDWGDNNNNGVVTDGAGVKTTCRRILTPEAGGFYLGESHGGGELPLLDQLDELLALEGKPHIGPLFQQSRSLFRAEQRYGGDGNGHGDGGTGQAD